MSTKIRKRKVNSKADVLKAEPGDELLVSFDVHKKNYHVAVRKNRSLAATWVMPHDDEAVVRMLKPAGEALRLVVYEAGPTGYGLARSLSRAGIPVAVTAPGKTPRTASPENKSDRVDCRKLGEYAENGLLKYVGIPTAEEDGERSVLRRRDTQRKELSRAKTRIKSFLLYHSLKEPVGLEDWKREAVERLRSMRLESDLRFTLDSLLRQFDFANDELRIVDRKLGEIKKRHNREAKILLSHPGVGKLTVHHVLAELFRPERFHDKREVVAYVGLAPKVSRSGQSCRSGGRLRGGHKALRDTLIEASWMWIRKDGSARSYYNRLLRNTGEAKKAITALARKMLVDLWTMLMRGTVYRPAAAFADAAPTSV